MWIVSLVKAPPSALPFPLTNTMQKGQISDLPFVFYSIPVNDLAYCALIFSSAFSMASSTEWDSFILIRALVSSASLQ